MSCSLCLESIELNEEVLHLCEDKSHGPCCKSCMEGYIKYQIDSQFSGSCSSILCPCVHKDKMKKQLIYSEWSTVLKELSEKYESFASSAISFRCYGCDSLRSLLPGTQSEEQIKSAWGMVEEVVNNQELLDEFRSLLHNFERGVDTADAVYKQICAQYLPTLWTMEDRKCFNVFVAVCKTMINPERRANLLLRHLNSKPHAWSYCCGRDICYKCQTAGFHSGISCEVNAGKYRS